MPADSLSTGATRLMNRGEERQHTLYGNTSFARFHSMCVRWSLLLFVMIYRRAKKMNSPHSTECFQQDEVQRCLYFLCEAATLLPSLPAQELESMLQLHDARVSVTVTRVVLNEDELRLQNALADCLDASRRDDFHISWNCIRPSDFPDAVDSRLSQYRSRSANEELINKSFAATMASRKQREMCAPPISTSFSSLQYLLALRDAESTPTYNPTVLQYNAKCTLQQVAYTLLTRACTEDAVSCYCLLPVYFDLCVISAAMDGLATRNDEETITAVEPSPPCGLPEATKDAFLMAVRIRYEKTVAQILRHYSDLPDNKDIEIVNTDAGPCTFSASIFRLLSEVVEPTTTLLHQYHQCCESQPQSSHTAVLARCMQSMWSLLVSTVLEGFEKWCSSGKKLERMLRDRSVLMFYLATA